MKNKLVTTFGGSNFLPTTSEYKEAFELGKYLARKGFVIKCGGYFGLMEAIAKGVKEANGSCIGITNTSFDPKNANEYISKEIKCNDLFDRLRELILDSDIFIVQHGSLGTLTELFLVWCLLYTQTIKNKEFFLIGIHWEKLIDSLKHLPISEQEFTHLKIFETVDDFILFFETPS